MMANLHILSSSEKNIQSKLNFYEQSDLLNVKDNEIFNYFIK